MTTPLWRVGEPDILPPKPVDTDAIERAHAIGDAIAAQEPGKLQLRDLDKAIAEIRRMVAVARPGSPELREIQDVGHGLEMRRHTFGPEY